MKEGEKRGKERRRIRKEREGTRIEGNNLGEGGREVEEWSNITEEKTGGKGKE